VISESTPVTIGVIVIIIGWFIASVGGIIRIDRRFSALERQVKEALRGRLTRAHFEYWAVRLELRNQKLGLKVPSLVKDDDDSSDDDQEPI